MADKITVELTLHEAQALVGGDYSTPDGVPSGDADQDHLLIRAAAEARRDGRRRLAKAISEFYSGR